MSDAVRRGFVPTDAIEFDESRWSLLQQAQSDVLTMLDRGYPIKSVSELVGNHYQLTERQRLAIVRATTASANVAARQAKCVTGSVNGGEVYIDGLNIIITLETALSRSTVYRCMDGTVRDLAAIRGTYRIIEHTHTAIRLLGDYLESIHAGRVTIYLDAPVSNTGRLKTLLAAYYETRSFALDIQLVPNADAMLKDKANVITSDAIILDACQSWLNAAAYMVEQRIRAVRLIPLHLPEPETGEADNSIYVAVKGILIEDGKALMVRRTGIMENDPIGWWEFPGGTMEFGESAEQTLVREFREETGLSVAPVRLLYENTVRMNPAYQIVVLTYLCAGEGREEVRLSTEHSAYQWAGGTELKKYLAKDIADALERHDLWGLFNSPMWEDDTCGK